MAKTVADVMKMVKENEVKFVDFRFTDTRGKEQHVTVPVSHFDEDKFVSGHAFDGSSIAGWKGIEASDMLLMPDPNTANIDPFFEEPTVILTCDVLEPGDGKPYERDPRSLAKRAEAYLKSSGIGDTAYFGPEPEFFIFDSGRSGRSDMSGAYVQDLLRRSRRGTPTSEFEGGNTGYRPAAEGWLLPRARRSTPSTTCAAAMCLIARSLSACRLKCITTKWPTARSERNRHQVQTPWCSRADQTHDAPSTSIQNVAHAVRQDCDLHAEAHRWRQRFRHARSPVHLEGRQEPVRWQRLRRPVRDRPVLHRRHHQARPRAERHHQPPAPTATSAWCPASRRR